MTASSRVRTVAVAYQHDLLHHLPKLTSNLPVNFSPVMKGCFAAC